MKPDNRELRGAEALARARRDAPMPGTAQPRHRCPPGPSAGPSPPGRPRACEAPAALRAVLAGAVGVVPPMLCQDGTQG